MHLAEGWECASAHLNHVAHLGDFPWQECMLELVPCTRATGGSLHHDETESHETSECWVNLKFETLTSMEMLKTDIWESMKQWRCWKLTSENQWSNGDVENWHLRVSNQWSRESQNIGCDPRSISSTSRQALASSFSWRTRPPLCDGPHHELTDGVEKQGKSCFLNFCHCVQYHQPWTMKLLLQARHPKHHIDDDHHCRCSVDPMRAGQPGLDGNWKFWQLATWRLCHFSKSNFNELNCQISAGHLKQTNQQHLNRSTSLRHFTSQSGLHRTALTASLTAGWL